MEMSRDWNASSKTIKKLQEHHTLPKVAAGAGSRRGRRGGREWRWKTARWRACSQQTVCPSRRSARLVRVPLARRPGAGEGCGVGLRAACRRWTGRRARAPDRRWSLTTRVRCAGAIFDLLAFLALLITGLFMGFKAMNADPNVRVFYYINAYVCGVATFAYFAMISGMGWETIMGCRQFFYVRYLDWAITTPLLILNLGLLAGEDMVLVAAVMGADIAMIFSGYMGSVALVPTVKWLWFVIGLVVYAPVVIAIVRMFRQTLIDKYTDVDRIELYSKVSLLTIIVWSIYPIVWMFAIGTGGLGVSAESIMYAILDVCSKCVFSFMIVQFNVYESAAPATAKEYV